MIEYTVKVYPCGSKKWYLNGKPHRTDGPAVEYSDGTKAWFLNGDLHRENGPAVEYGDGTKFWYLNGRKVTEKEVMGPKDPKMVHIKKLEAELALLKAEVQKET